MKVQVTHRLPLPKYEDVYNTILDRLSDHGREMFLMLGDEETSKSPMVVFERVFGIVLPDTVEYELTGDQIEIRYEAFVFDATPMGKVAVEMLLEGFNLKAYFKMMARFDGEKIWQTGFQLLTVEVDKHETESTVKLIEAPTV